MALHGRVIVASTGRKAPTRRTGDAMAVVTRVCRTLAAMSAPLLMVLASACGGGGGVDHPRGAATEWTAFGGAPGGGHYSAATEITPENVHALELAWEHRSGDLRDPPASGAGEINGPPQQTSFEVTPIVAGSTLYYCTP